MAEIKQIYKCERCGIIVETLHGGGGELTCCHAPMVLLEAKTADSTTEKHVPVIEKIDGGYKVIVGSTLHPMEEKHQIEWIELIADGKVLVKGSPDQVLEKCTHWHDGEKINELTPQKKKQIIKHYNQMAENALRVLAFAEKKIGARHLAE